MGHRKAVAVSGGTEDLLSRLEPLDAARTLVARMLAAWPASRLDTAAVLMYAKAMSDFPIRAAERAVNRIVRDTEQRRIPELPTLLAVIREEAEKGPAAPVVVPRVPHVAPEQVSMSTVMPCPSCKVEFPLRDWKQWASIRKHGRCVKCERRGDGA